MIAVAGLPLGVVITKNIVISAVIIGLYKGTIYALMSLGMIACHRINRVINLGQAGLAAFAAAIYWWMTATWGAPLAVSALGGVLASTVVGAFLGYANLKMRDWPRGLVMIVTLGVTLLLFATVDKILPAFGVTPQSPFGTSGFNFALTYISSHQIGTFITAVTIVLLATWVIKKTRVGMAVRAIYDHPNGAATLGVPISAFVIGVWAVGGALAGIAGILVTAKVALDPTLLLFVLVWSLAASVVGGLESFALAYAGALVLGISQGVIGGVFSGALGPGMENLAAIVVVGAAVVWAGIKRRDFAHIQV